MPRNVRNFWIELEVDGRKTRIATGPIAADGGFVLTVRQRDRGGIITPLRLGGYADAKGYLTLVANSGNGNELVLARTSRR